MKLTRIFLDIDDVCNKFTMYALKTVGCNIDVNDESVFNPEWGFDLVKAANELYTPPGKKRLFDFTKESFWSNLPEDVWVNAPISNEFLLLLDLSRHIVGLRNVYFLSTPTLCPLSCSGKLKWLKQCAPKSMQRQYLFGPPKHLCATPDSLLIDDNDEKVFAFRRAGGQAISMPRPWNTNHYLATAGLTIEYIKTELRMSP